MVFGLVKTIRSSFTWNKENLNENCEETMFHFNGIFQQNFSNIESVDSFFHESNFARKPCTVYLFRFKITVCIVFKNGVRSVVLEI